MFDLSIDFWHFGVMPKKDDVWTLSHCSKKFKKSIQGEEIVEKVPSNVKPNVLLHDRRDTPHTVVK